MAQAKMSSRVGSAVRASHAAGAVVDRSRPARRHDLVRAALRRLLSAIVRGSDQPCWRMPDPSAQLALLPPREQNRLLDTGRLTASR